MPSGTPKSCCLRDLLTAVETIAPRRLAEDWDRVGLQVGDPSQAIRRVMTCLELTPATLAEARRRRADAVVAHHPLLFRPLNAVDVSQPVPRLVAGLIQAKIGFLAAHTNLDAAVWGTNQAFCERMGWTAGAPLILGPNDDSNEGLGCHVRLARAVSLEDLAKPIKRALGLKSLRVSGVHRRKLRELAVCAGAGGGLIDFLAGRVDALVTGEINYHRAMEAEQRGLTVIEVGHFESEALVAEPWAARLAADAKLASGGVRVFPAQRQKSPFSHV